MTKNLRTVLISIFCVLVCVACVAGCFKLVNPDKKDDTESASAEPTVEFYRYLKPVASVEDTVAMIQNRMEQIEQESAPLSIVSVGGKLNYEQNQRFEQDSISMSYMNYSVEESTYTCYIIGELEGAKGLFFIYSDDNSENALQNWNNIVSETFGSTAETVCFKELLTVSSFGWQADCFDLKAMLGYELGYSLGSYFTQSEVDQLFTFTQEAN